MKSSINHNIAAKNQENKTSLPFVQAQYNLKSKTPLDKNKLNKLLNQKRLAGFSH